MPRKNAILLFSKVPEAGKVKTRLTPIKDGKLPPEWASYLYNCMLFDVVECCCDLVAQLQDEQDEYSIVISSPGQEQRDAIEALFSSSGQWPQPLTFISDEGKSFDEHYNCSFQKTWDMGFDTILSMGCDMPALTREIMVAGFDYLHRLCDVEGGGIVLSPDQEMGVSIIGWTRDTDFTHDGVFYNPTGLTVLPAYVQKAAAVNLPCYYIPAMPDVDTMLDLIHNVTLCEAIEYSARFQEDLTVPARTLDCMRQLGLTKATRVMPNDLRDDRDEIDG